MAGPRLALIGAGSMGANHARVASTIRDWELVQVIDPDEDRARTVAKACDTAWGTSLDELVGDVDAAIIACSTSEHVSVGLTLLDRGLHLLIEKPLAPTAEEATLLAAAAERSDRAVLIGYVERFNGAVRELARWLGDDVYHIEMRRLGPQSRRMQSDAIFDLMIHDLDLLDALRPDEVRAAQSVLMSFDGRPADVALARLEYESGWVASLSASRMSQLKQRQITMWAPDAQVEADLVRQSVAVHRTTMTEFSTSGGGQSFRQASLVEIPYLDQGEPLRAEHLHFLDVIRGDAPPIVVPRAAIRTLGLAEQLRHHATKRALS